MKPPEYATEIQLLINQYRAKHDLSQARLAKLLKVTQSQLCKWELGTHKPSKLRLKQLKFRLLGRKKEQSNVATEMGGQGVDVEGLGPG